MLPFEILELVFSYLSPKDLDTVPLVCRAWHDVASDRVWHKSFRDHFGTDEITPVSLPLSQWRREALTRRQILQKWRRGAKKTDKTINTSLKDASDIYLNFAGDEAGAYCFNPWQGLGTAIDLERGKIRRRIQASRFETVPVSLTDGSRFGMIFGFSDGHVSGISFSRDGSYTVDHVDFAYRHASAVSALWIAKTRSFAKPVGSAVSVASGSQDGTVILTNGVGYKEFRPSRSRVLVIEGCVYGMNVANDGHSVVAIYADGGLYRFTPTEDSSFEMTKIGILPLTLDLIDAALQLEQCNDCIIFSTRKFVHIHDLVSGEMTELELPANAEITALTLDSTFAPGAKCLVLALSTNDICMFSIPACHKPESETKKVVVIVNGNTARQIESPNDNFVSVSWDAAAPSERTIKSEPVWQVPNPIGYDARLAESGKPQVTKLAANSAVVLVGGYNGRAIAVDILSGTTLKRVDSRISRTVLDFNQYSRDGFVPITHLQIDNDPNRLRGLIGVRPAIQYFDLGKADFAKRRTRSRTKRNSSKRKRRDINLDSSTLVHDMNEELALNEEFALEDAENDDLRVSLRADFTLSDMEDEEQVEYALMLSQQHEEEGGEEDEELRRVLEMSRLNNTTEVATESDEMDEDLRRALELSLQA